MSDVINGFRLTEAPQNGCVLQRDNNRASFTVRGEFFVDPTDDTELPYPFSPDKAFLRMVSENDGMPVTDNFPVTTEDGFRFESEIRDVPVGGPYTLDLIYQNPETCLQYPMRGERRRHIFVGDVYLIVGQSNAAGMGMGQVTEEPIEAVRVFRDLAFWDVATFPFCDKDLCKQSMMLSFGKRIFERTGVPVGFIPAAMGGAPIDRFLPEKRGDLYRKTQKALRNCGTDVCAAIWYQGCCEAGSHWTSEKYFDAFSSFVSLLREDLKQPDLPVFTFQLNRFVLPEENPATAEGYSAIREAQRQAALRIRNVFVLPTSDGVSISDFIHGSASFNRVLGERLAAQVLPFRYGIGRTLRVPSIRSAEAISPTEILLTFDGIGSFLFDFHAGVNLPIRVENGDAVIPILSYRIGSDRLSLTLKDPVSEGATVSAQYGNDPKFWLCDFDSQMPLISFTHYPIRF